MYHTVGPAFLFHVDIISCLSFASCMSQQSAPPLDFKFMTAKLFASALAAHGNRSASNSPDMLIALVLTRNVTLPSDNLISTLGPV